MDNINFQICNPNENCNTEFESSLRSEPTLVVTNLSENVFETIIKNIKKENLLPVPDEYYDFEEVMDEKLCLQDNISTPSSVNVSKSSIQVLENTKLLVTQGIPPNMIPPTGSFSLTTMNGQRKNNLSTKSHSFSHHVSKPVTTSMSIAHICTNNCEWCKTFFAVLDNPNHIGRVRNVDKQNAFLNIKPTLKIDSCLCDRCWKFLEKTYKFNKNKKIRGVSSNSNGSNKVNRDFEEQPNTIVELTTQSSKNFKTRNDQIFSCSVHNCKQEVDLHPLSLEECTKIIEILLKADVHTMILITSHKWGSDERGPISLSVCEEHLQMIHVLTTCQLCGNELGENLNTDYWKMYDQWNCILARNNIPLKLLPGMFLCDTCLSFVSNSEFVSTINLKSLQQNVKKRNDVCMKLFEVLKNVNVIKKKETVKTIKYEDEFKVNFTEPLVTATYYYKSFINDHRFRKIKGKKLTRFSKSLDLLTYSTVKSNTNVESSNSEITKSDLVNNIDELSPSVNTNFKHDIETHYATPKIGIINEKADIKEDNDSLLKNTEEKHQIFTKMYLRRNSPSNYHYRKPIKRIRKLMSLITKNDDLKCIKTSIRSKQIKENSPVSSTKLDAGLVLDSMNKNSDDNFTTNKDAGEDLLRVPPSQLDKDEVEMFEDEHNSSNMPLVGSVFSLLSDQTVCVASDEKTDDCAPLTISQTSVQSTNSGICNRIEMFEDRKTNDSMPLVDSVFSLLSDQTVCVASDEKTDDCAPLTISQTSVQSTNSGICNRIEMFEDRKTNDSMPLVDSVFSLLSDQTVCVASDEKTDDCAPLTISQTSVQSSNSGVCNRIEMFEDKKTNDIMPIVDSVFSLLSDQTVCVASDEKTYDCNSETSNQYSAESSNNRVCNRIEIFEDKKTNDIMPIVDSVFSLLSDQTVCVASDEKTYDCNSETSNQYSAESSNNRVCNRIEIFEDKKTNDVMPIVDSVFSSSSSQTVCRASDEKTYDCNSETSNQCSAQSSNSSISNKVEMFEDRKINNSMPIVDSVFLSSSSQTVCRANDEKTDCTPLTLSQPSVQSYKVVCNTIDEETKTCPELISLQNIADQSESSSDFDDDYEYLSEKESIFKREDLNEFVECKNVLHPVRLDNFRVDPVEIKNRLRNVVCQRIKGTKKQRLNETHELNDTLPYKSDNETNSSHIDVEDSSFESYKHKNINNKIPNLPGVLSLFSKNTNENMLNSNYSDVSIQNISYDEETIMSIDPDDTQNRNSDEVEEIIMSNNPTDVQNIINNESEKIMSNGEADVQNIINDDEEIIMSNNPDDIQNTSNNEREIIISKDQVDVQYISSDEETIMSNYQNCMNDSSPERPLLQIESVCSLKPSSLQLNQTFLKIPHYTMKDTCPRNADNIDANKTATDDEFSPDSCDSQYKINEFPRLPKVNTQSTQQNEKDNYHELCFEVNNSNEYIYRDLLAKFGDPTAVISYLMENERLFFSGKLVISDTTRPHAANYLKKHLEVLKAWYGDPEDNDLSESFISASYPEVRLYSQRLSSDIPNLSKSDDASISTCSSPSSQNFLSLPNSSDYSISCVPEVQEEVTSQTFCPYNFSPIMTNQTDEPLLPVPNQSLPPTDICLTPNLKIDERQPASIIQPLTAVRSKEKSKSDESNIDTSSLSSQNPLSSQTSSENLTNCIPKIQEVSSCMPLMSNQAANVLLLAPKQSRPPTAIRFAPNFKNVQCQSAPFFQLPTAVRSKVIQQTRPLDPNPYNK